MPMQSQYKHLTSKYLENNRFIGNYWELLITLNVPFIQIPINIYCNIVMLTIYNPFFSIGNHVFWYLSTKQYEFEQFKIG